MAPGLKHVLYLPPFGELSDPQALVDLAVAAEEAGWDGFFLWDHLLRPPLEPSGIADAWMVVAAVAARTEKIRIGPMVTPLPRRRPQKLAKEIATVDSLSRGRLIVGLGIGVDDAGELSRFGDVVDPRTRGDMLDEGLELMCAAWSGDRITHRSGRYLWDDVRLLPRPHQQPRPPVWLAARGCQSRPLRRAASYDGLFPIETDASGVGLIAEEMLRLRGSLQGFDIAVAAIPGIDLATYQRNGATWALWAFLPGAVLRDVYAFIAAGPLE